MTLPARPEIKTTSELTELRMALNEAHKAQLRTYDQYRMEAARVDARLLAELSRAPDWAALSEWEKKTRISAVAMDDADWKAWGEKVQAAREAEDDAMAAWDAAMAEWRRRECEAAERRW